MGFTSRRGRPRKEKIIKLREEKDLGTLELQAKRARGMTKEPIDVCREHGIADDDQYAAAMHFRWLYTLRFGAPTVSAVSLISRYGRELESNDENWQAEREKEYALAIKTLRGCGALKIVMNIAVFNHFPPFLQLRRVPGDEQALYNRRQLAKFREGLDALAETFKHRR